MSKGSGLRFVLVHGGWQGGWCWNAVSAELRAAGHEVLAPTLRGSEGGPTDRIGVDLTSMGEGLVDVIRRRRFGDFVLVGHSGGGPVSQYAADRLAADIRRIVFVDAWVLHDGEAINDVLPAALVADSVAAVEANENRSVPMQPDVWADHFMNGASPLEVAAVLAKLGPVPFGWLSEPISLPRFWKTALPSSYVFLREDRAVPQELYRAMAARLNHPRLIECDGPHEAMLTHPVSLARALLEAAKE
jgi:pimeloyl-ACP methyl ester carboxylesterase